MEVKHTPGPWTVLAEEVDCPYIRVRGTVLGCRYKIANILTPTYDGVHECEAAETRANANLIASAPAMLEAIQWVANNIGAHPEMIRRVVGPAIASATGA